MTVFLESAEPAGRAGDRSESGSESTIGTEKEAPKFATQGL